MYCFLLDKQTDLLSPETFKYQNSIQELNEAAKKQEGKGSFRIVRERY